MKVIIILICLLISTNLSAQETEVNPEISEEEKKELKELEKREDEEREKKEAAEEERKEERKEEKKEEAGMSEQEKMFRNSYYGGNLIFYNQATLNAENLSKPKNPGFGDGFGFDLFYQSYISTAFHFKILFEFLYNSYSNPFKVNIDDYPLEPGIEADYTQDEKFYNFLGGFIFSYYIYLDKLFHVPNALKGVFPYFSTGLMSSSVYKTYDFKYDKGPIDFIDDQPKTTWLSTAITIPFCFGINYMINPQNVINLNFTYLLINFDEFSKKNGYKNILNFKLGYMRTINFKL